VSCQRNSHAVARSSARLSGIARLASQAGAVKVAAGLLAGVAVLALARKYAGRRPGARGILLRRSPAVSVLPHGRELPALPGRARIPPADANQLMRDCPMCGAIPQRKAGSWYVIEGKPHCQACTERSRSDCAPQAVEAAGASLARPPGASTALSPATWHSGGQPAIKLDFAGMYLATETETVALAPGAVIRQMEEAQPCKKVQGKILSVALGKEVRLERQRIKVSLEGAGRAPIDTDAYVAVIAGEGQETGLAIVPRVMVTRRGVQVEDKQWGVMHLKSGRMLGEEWFENPIEAQGAVEILAQLDWKRDFGEISAVEKADVDRTVRAYHAALRHVK
jgi:hypothetical protein